MRKLIGQGVIFLQQTETISNSCLKSAEAVMNSAESANEGFKKFNTACIQVYSTKKQHCCNLYFWLLG